MSFRDLLEAGRRLCILRILVECDGHANESVVEQAMLQLGHRAQLDRDAVRGFLRDLAERDLITIEHYRDKVMVASITKRGVAAAEGRITVDGVAKPSLGD